MQLIVATRNAHKAREIQRIFGPAFTVSDLSEHPEIPEIRETVKSFEENAILKAIGASRHLPGLIVADDSGLEVDALGGAPGVFSARYAGENATDKQNIDKLLCELAPTGAKETKRSARFRCVIALARHGKPLRTVEGLIEGTLVERKHG
jgi:XTP/dITP diphosphohydrolase